MVLTTTVLRHSSELAGLEQDWERLVAASGADSVFMSFRWLNCWLQIMAPVGQLFVVQVKSGDRVIALAPLVIVQQTEARFPVRRLQFMGAPHADYSDLLIDGDRPGCIREILACLMDHAVEWDLIEFLHLTDESPNWLPLSGVIKDMAIDSSVERWAVAPYARLPASFEDYIGSRPKSLRYDLRKGEQGLRQLGGVRYEVLSNRIAALEALPGFIKMLRRRESSVGRSGSDASVERLCEFFSALLKSDDKCGQIHFSRLMSNQEAIAYHFGFVGENKFYWYKPAFEPSYSRYSPGKLILKHCVEHAISARLEEFDCLLGDEPYKFQWAHASRASFNVLLFNARWYSRLLRSWLLHIKPLLKKARAAWVHLYRAVCQSQVQPVGAA